MKSLVLKTARKDPQFRRKLLARLKSPVEERVFREIVEDEDLYWGDFLSTLEMRKIRDLISRGLLEDNGRLRIFEVTPKGYKEYDKLSP